MQSEEYGRSGGLGAGDAPADAASRSAVGKAIAVLKVLGHDPFRGFGVSEIGRRLGLSKSTTHRILHELVRHEAVQRYEGEYTIAPWLAPVRQPADSERARDIRELLTPFLSMLYERTRATVHLAVLEGTEVLYLNKLEGQYPVESPSRLGGRAPAYCTGVGKLLLAYHREASRAVLSSPLHGRTPHTITTPEALRDELRGIRATGVAFDREEIQPGLTCVAMPVMGAEGPLAGFSVSGPVGRFDPGAAKAALREVCAAASRASGRRY